jgi:hypothetical protein
MKMIDDEDDNLSGLMHLGIVIFIISILIGALLMLWQVIF